MELPITITSENAIANRTENIESRVACDARAENIESGLPATRDPTTASRRYRASVQDAAPFTSAHDPVNQVKLAATVPTPMNCVSTVSPALTGAGLVNDPDMIRCPACNRLP